MARMTIDPGGLDQVEASFDVNTRAAIRSIVEAGAKAAATTMQQAIKDANHVRTGSMRDSVRATEYRETLGGGQMSVYPQGTDSKGVSNTIKAYVINYGRGKRKRGSRMGDKFITSREQESKAEAAVAAAMQAEADRIAEGMNG